MGGLLKRVFAVAWPQVRNVDDAQAAITRPLAINQRLSPERYAPTQLVLRGGVTWRQPLVPGNRHRYARGFYGLSSTQADATEFPGGDPNCAVRISMARSQPKRM